MLGYDWCYLRLKSQFSCIHHSTESL